MKKLAFVMLLAVSITNAQDNGEGKWSELDKEKWGEIRLANRDIKTYSNLQADLKTFDNILQRAANQSVFTSSDFSKLEQFINEVGNIALYTNAPKIEKTNSSNSAYKAGEDAIKALSGELARLESLRRNLVAAANIVYGYQLQQKIKLWNNGIKRIEKWGHTKTFAEFDQVFGEFMKFCDELAKNKKTDVSVLGVARVSRLDKFTNTQVKTRPDFDRDLRVLDSYLYAMRKIALDDFKQGLKSFNVEIIETEKMINHFKNLFNKENDIKLYPTDRQIIQRIYTNLEIVANNGLDLIMSAEDLIKKIEDNSTELGKLRSLKGFNNNKAFTAYGSPKEDGTQNYTGRVRVALENCRNYYKKVMKNLGVNNPQW